VGYESAEVGPFGDFSLAFGFGFCEQVEGYGGYAERGDGR